MSGLRRITGERGNRDGREARIDPVCHTLAGAALARTGLGRRTALGASALVIGANLPDLDAIAYFAGPMADLEWRRGWSHGVLAIAVLPFLLTGCLLLLHRATSRRRRWYAHSAVVPGQLLLLSFVAILSHPILDTLNTYGVRWLIPFSGRWFYGDALFIIDPWVWLALSLGLYYSARRGRAKRSSAAAPALALGLVTVYAGAMALLSLKTEEILMREAAGAGPVQGVMAGPVPLDPSARKFVIEQGLYYRTGTFGWLDSPRVDLDQVLTFPRGRPEHPAFALAAESLQGRRFLGWARYPTVDIKQVGTGRFLVHLVDLRYATGPGERFGTVSIPVTLQASGPAPASP